MITRWQIMLDVLAAKARQGNVHDPVTWAEIEQIIRTVEETHRRETETVEGATDEDI